MSKQNNTAQKPTREDGPVVHAEPALGTINGPMDVETTGNLDKVREILFGAQVRESEKRQQRLEERLLRELTEIREEIRRRYDTLDAFVRQELETLSERLVAERAQRLESVESLSRDHKENVSNIHKKLATADELLSKTQRELRQHRHGTALLETVTRWADANHLRLSLFADPIGDDGPSLNRLIRWYKRHGFERIRGKSRRLMLRKPPGAPRQ